MNLRSWIFIILILLAATLTIVALRYKQSAAADRAASLRNLQQWGIALTLYLMEHDSQLPEVGSLPLSPEQTNAWYNALPPYLSAKPLTALDPAERSQTKTPSIWIDPANKTPVRPDGPYLFQYGMNHYLQPDSTLRSFKINELQRPANVIFMAETSSKEPFATPENVAYRHGSNSAAATAEAFVTFADGHVAPVPRSQLSDSPDSLRADAAGEGKVSWFKE
ncbi:MAG: hypothetical protein ACK5NG_05705 [Chthoniobacterales bacterium]